MDEAEYCGRVSLMVDGSIAQQGSPRELKQRFGCATLHDVFLKVSTAGQNILAAGRAA
jgi:ABC-2 type transport system ATP-binding protein